MPHCLLIRKLISSTRARWKSSDTVCQVGLMRKSAQLSLGRNSGGAWSRRRAREARSHSRVPSGRDFVYGSSVTGRHFARVDHFASARAERQSRASPTGVAHFPQHRLLPLLMQRAQSEDVAIWMGSELVGFDESDAGVTVSVRHADSTTSRVECDFLVAADGAHSLTREQLGVTLSGRSAVQHLMNIHFAVDPTWLRRATRDSRPAMLYFIYNPDVVCVLVAHDADQGEFVCQVPYFPPHQGRELFTDDVCRRVLTAAIMGGHLGSDVPGLRIHSVRSWAMHARVAARYTSPDHQRVVLIGDAAHQLPPAGGFGMNTAIQDAHNLAWKLAMIHRGQARRQLLSSYESERRPVAIANTALSLRNYEKTVCMAESVGLHREHPSLMTELATALPISDAARREFVRGALRIGQAPLAALGGARMIGEARIRALKRLLQRGGGLPLLFPTNDLGFAYPSGGDDDQDHRTSQEAAAACSEDPLLTVRLGGRMPHCRLSTCSSPPRIFSLVDIPTQLEDSDCASPQFAVLMDARTAKFWVAAVRSSMLPAFRLLKIRAPPECGGVMTPPPATQCELFSPVGSQPFPDGTGAFDAIDIFGEWSRATSSAHVDLVLVRPDGHVAWAASAASFADPTCAAAAMCRALDGAGLALDRTSSF